MKGESNERKRRAGAAYRGHNSSAAGSELRGLAVYLLLHNRAVTTKCNQKETDQSLVGLFFYVRGDAVIDILEQLPFGAVGIEAEQRGYQARAE